MHTREAGATAPFSSSKTDGRVTVAQREVVRRARCGDAGEG